MYESFFRINMIKYIIPLILLFSIQKVIGCGCYGPSSCDFNSVLSFCTTQGFCDCCSECNTCNQLLAGCSALNTLYDGYFEPTFPTILNLNQNLKQYFIYSSSSSNDGYYLQYPPCIRPNLPEGIYINISSDNKLYLSGMPTQIVPPTVYTLKVKGAVGQITAMTFTISVVQLNGQNCNHSDPPCEYGFEKCLSGNSYQTCNLDQNGNLYWGTTQYCTTGTTCSSSNNYIYCV